MFLFNISMGFPYCVSERDICHSKALEVYKRSCNLYRLFIERSIGKHYRFIENLSVSSSGLKFLVGV